MGGLIVIVLFLLLTFGCFYISIRALKTKTIPISKNNQWTGNSTLILSIPLLLLGIFLTLVLIFTYIV